MYVRIDRTWIQPERDHCRCSGYSVRATCRPRIVAAVRTHQGPRQRTILRLPAYRSCCIQHRTAQELFWAEVERRLAKRRDLAPRAMLTRIGEAISRDLGPVREVTGEQPSRASSFIDEDGRGWVRPVASPDLTRLAHLPAELEQRLGEPALMLRVARDVRDPELDSESWPALAFQLEHLALTIPSLADALTNLATLPLTAARLRAQHLEHEARCQFLAQCHPLPSQITFADLTTARKRVTEFVSTVKTPNTRSRSTRAFFRQAGRRRRLLPHLRAFIAGLPPERVTVVSEFLRGSSQREAGERVLSAPSPSAAQRAVSRHLRAFRVSLARALKESS